MGVDIAIESSWAELLREEFDKPYFVELMAFVEQQYATETIYPPKESIFHALNSCPANRVKVVIIGQDPYHNPGQANGLCFSVGHGVARPRSLGNIFKELVDDIGANYPNSNNLDPWAEQGVLLLNATLTVRAHEPNSHSKMGWGRFTDAIVAQLNEQYSGIVYILWGGSAQQKGSKIDPQKNHIIKSAHPSPLSAYGGFFGSKPFTKTNHYLRSIGTPPIEWRLP